MPPNRAPKTLMSRARAGSAAAAYSTYGRSSTKSMAAWAYGCAGARKGALSTTADSASLTFSKMPEAVLDASSSFLRAASSSASFFFASASCAAARIQGQGASH